MRALVTGGTRGIGAAICAELERVGHHCMTFSRKFGYDATIASDRQAVKDMNGHCDILIHNVGGGGCFGSNEEVMGKNVEAMIDFTQWALDGMLQRKWGRVVAISSIHGREFGSRAVFMAAKAAQIAYMKGCSKQWAPHGITFNTVCPGNVKVEGKPDVEGLPMGRMGKPEEVAKLVAFLCSEDAAWINGSCITIDGGESNAL